MTVQPVRDAARVPLRRDEAARRVLSDFRFWGFEDLRWAQVAQRKISVYDADPSVTVVDDGVFIPATRNSGNEWPQLHALGGVLDAQGYPVSGANLRRLGGGITFAGIPDDFTVDVRAEQTLDEEIVCLGWLFDQYGHFLLESLARTWFLWEIDSATRVAFHATRRSWPLGSVRRALELFGIPPERAVIFDVPTCVKRMHIPQPLYELGCAHARAAEPFRAVASRIVGAPDPIPSRQPVYLSRRLLPSDRREVIGEDELEEVLRDNGFLIAYPELMTFEDQVRLFNRHADIFACEGSATHSALFAMHRPHIHLFVPGAVTPQHFLVSSVANTSLTFVRCLVTRQDVIRTRQKPQLVDLSRVADYLEECGLLRSRLRVTLAERAARQSWRFEEACLCAQIDAARSRGALLSDEVAAHATHWSERSWRICWHLLHYFAAHEPRRVEETAWRFTDLVSSEHNTSLLAKYNRQMGRKSRVVLRAVLPHLTQKAQDRLWVVLHERFPQ